MVLFLTIHGIPWLENILYIFGIIALAEVECTMSTLGNREYASMTTKRYSPIRNGPQKSM